MTTINAAIAMPGTPASEGRAASFAGGDFETFLRMLTTQLKHQDPLNPMEGSDFAVQLATFSGVEQQAHTNQLLEVLGRQMGVSGLSQLSGWIGKEARSSEPVWFGAHPVTLEIQPDRGADQVILVTLDEQGREIGREDIGPGRGQVDWFGRDMAGDKVPDGLYSFRIESMQGGQVMSTRPVEVYGRVTEARLAGSEVMLVLEGGSEIAVSAVTALRDPR